jgi:3'-phosphoadenosine 5'-phosphosulfate sulfotransferase (PAPS reductase)/FAD synthetase
VFSRVLRAGDEMVQNRNMRDPFKIDSPTCISFSGGRTSAYMLWRVLQSNGGLPPEAVVCFANTGKEDEATLRFVRDCGQNWNVPIVWVEYRPDGYAVVDFDTASRNGEPFEAIIRKRNYLPNPVTRFCTVELKIRAMHKHLRSLGWGEGDHCWDQMVGIRADEQRRVAKIRARPSPETVKETMCLPLADAGVTVRDVGAFWEAQAFNLGLPTYNGRTLAGNCDLCFLKPAQQVVSLIAERPERAVWWAKIETMAMALASKPDGAVFRKDRPSYAQMLTFTQAQADAFGHLVDDGIECVGCTD